MPGTAGELLLSPETALFLSCKLEKGGSVPFFAKPLHQGSVPKRGKSELISCELQTGLGATAGCSPNQGLCRAQQPALGHPCQQSGDTWVQWGSAFRGLGSPIWKAGVCHPGTRSTRHCRCLAHSPAWGSLHCPPSSIRGNWPRGNFGCWETPVESPWVSLGCRTSAHTSRCFPEFAGGRV